MGDSTDDWLVNRSIARGPSQSITTRQWNPLMESSLIVDAIAASADRYTDNILTFARGVNPMVSIQFSNADGRPAKLPYTILHDGAFRPPIRTMEETTPLSRLPHGPITLDGVPSTMPSFTWPTTTALASMVADRQPPVISAESARSDAVVLPQYITFNRLAAEILATNTSTNPSQFKQTGGVFRELAKLKDWVWGEVSSARTGVKEHSGGPIELPKLRQLPTVDLDATWAATLSSLRTALPVADTTLVLPTFKRLAQMVAPTSLASARSGPVKEAPRQPVQLPAKLAPQNPNIPRTFTIETSQGQEVHLKPRPTQPMPNIPRAITTGATTARTTEAQLKPRLAQPMANINPTIDRGSTERSQEAVLKPRPAQPMPNIPRTTDTKITSVMAAAPRVRKDLVLTGGGTATRSGFTDQNFQPLVVQPKKRIIDLGGREPIPTIPPALNESPQIATFNKSRRPI